MPAPALYSWRKGQKVARATGPARWWFIKDWEFGVVERASATMYFTFMPEESSFTRLFGTKETASCTLIRLFVPLCRSVSYW